MLLFSAGLPQVYAQAPRITMKKAFSHTAVFCNCRRCSLLLAWHFLLQMERRERLRKLLAEREAAGEGAPDGAPLIGQVRNRR
jgi:hypothetical protein